MYIRRVPRSLFILCFLLLAVSSCFARSKEQTTYEPRHYQAGKDVVWVPTEYKLAEKMLNLAKVTPGDYVIDLGSGDGRIVIAAAKRGARALGIEYNPDLVELSKKNAERAGVADKAKFVQGDIFKSDFSQATVVTLFLLPELNLQLRPIILNMKPGVRIVSNSFNMGDWAPDDRVFISEAEGCKEFFCEAYLWIVPAKVEGVWQAPQGNFTIQQNYQKISGRLKNKTNGPIEMKDSSLKGDKISFRCGKANYSGTVNGSRIQGTMRENGKDIKWEAVRVGSVVNAAKQAKQ